MSHRFNMLFHYIDIFMCAKVYFILLYIFVIKFQKRLLLKYAFAWLQIWLFSLVLHFIKVGNLYLNIYIVR